MKLCSNVMKLKCADVLITELCLEEDTWQIFFIEYVLASRVEIYFVYFIRTMFYHLYCPIVASGTLFVLSSRHTLSQVKNSLETTARKSHNDMHLGTKFKCYLPENRGSDCHLPVILLL